MELKELGSDMGMKRGVFVEETCSRVGSCKLTKSHLKTSNNSKILRGFSIQFKGF